MKVASQDVLVGRTRLTSIDLLRGLVMIIMALDHTRDFVHQGGLLSDPTNLATTTPILFMTRWITHFCAPVFVFLAGVSAYLQGSRGLSTPEVARFLFTRGLWLVVLEFTVINACIWFALDYTTFFSALQVIWALGVSMIVLSALVYLPLRVVAGIGLAIIVLHNAFDAVRVDSWQGPGTPAPSALGKLWIVLHQGGEFVPIVGDSGPIVFVVYPLIPWIGVMAAGYACGAIFTLEAAQRRRALLWSGAALIALFVALRLPNLYGDPRPWSMQGTAVFTLLSFVNTTKYPVSLQYLLMTLGPSLLLLAWFDSRRPSRLGQIVTRVGRVPLFFYLGQWLFAHGLAIVVTAAAGKSTAHLFTAPPAIFTNTPPDAGFDLWVVYVCWAAVVLALIPLCLWFARVKERYPVWWMRFL